MKLTVPPLEIGEKEGFSEDKDIFKRKEFGERLANLIENAGGELVMALDAPWGEGKSTFIKMWQGHLKNEYPKIKTIYFDAFENDHQSAPFLALAGEIYALIDEQIEQPIFRHKAIAALKTTKRIGLRLGARVLTAGLLDGTEFEGVGKKDILDGAVDTIDSYVENILKSATKDKEVVAEFKKYLAALPEKLGGKSIVFIIDELDRCKPPFALEIVEVVKHLFTVPNIAFVLVLNRTQLEASVIKEYGTDEADASKYLQKFINLWISLPKNKESERCDAKTYLSDCIKRMGLESKDGKEEEWNKMMFERLVVHYNMPLREIERSLTNFALIRGSFSGAPNYVYRWITAYVSIIKVRYPDEYNLLSKGKITYPALVDKTYLTELKDNWMMPEEKAIESHPLKWLLRYYLANDTEKGKLRTPENPFGAIELSASGQVIENSCNWLDSFRKT